MAEICNLEAPAHRLVVGLDLLAELISDLDRDGIDNELHARAWFVVQALKVEAAGVTAGITRIIEDLPKPWLKT